jgi:hypothetical protein
MGFLDKLFGRDKSDSPTEAPAEEQPHGSIEDDASEITHAEERLDDIRDQATRNQTGLP